MNTNSKIKILFFTPFAGYTGSEVMLFSMIKNLNPEKFEIAVFSMEQGELLDTLPENIPFYFYNSHEGLFKRIVNKFLTTILGAPKLERQLMNIQRSFKADVWYLNTLLLGDIMQIAQKKKIKYAVHFHELDSQYKFTTKNVMKSMLNGAIFTVGCCECVCNNLKILGAPNIHKQYECIETASIKIDNKKTQVIRQQLQISRGHKVITMAGQRSERKGMDLFIKVANELRDKPYVFLWLGASPNTGYELFFEKFIDYYKLTNIHLIHPAREDYYTYLNLTDIFFLSSREDPFPLVMIEAAYMSKYIISLNSGGVQEFIKDGIGHIISSWNISDIANELHSCCQGLVGEETVNSRKYALEFDTSNQIKLFEKLLMKEFAQ